MDKKNKKPLTETNPYLVEAIKNGTYWELINMNAESSSEVEDG